MSEIDNLQHLPPPPVVTAATIAQAEESPLPRPPAPTIPVNYTVTLPLKSVSTAYLWSLFLGIYGAHQFYLGKTGRGFIYFFTLGGCGFAVLYDWFTMSKQVERANAEIRAGVRVG